jgi:hypothetical protein
LDTTDRSVSTLGSNAHRATRRITLRTGDCDTGRLTAA